MTQTPTPLEQAYETMDYAVVEQSADFELPAATPAVFNYNDYEGGLGYTDPDAIVTDLQRGETPYVFIGVFTKARDGKVYVTAKVYDTERNESFQIRLYSRSFCLFPTGDLSFEAFERFITYAETALDIELLPKPSSRGGHTVRGDISR